jgi:hypothetical protein
MKSIQRQLAPGLAGGTAVGIEEGTGQALFTKEDVDVDPIISMTGRRNPASMTLTGGTDGLLPVHINVEILQSEPWWFALRIWANAAP